MNVFRYRIKSHQGGILMKNVSGCKRAEVIGIVAALLMLSGCRQTEDTGLGYGSVDSASLNHSTGVEKLLKTEEAVFELQVEKNNLHLNVGQSEKLSVTVSNQRSAIYRLDYVSSDETVCTVKRDGTVQGIGNGEAVITIEEEFTGTTIEVAVTVDELIYPERIQLSKEAVTLMMGESVLIQAVIEPEDAADQEVEWSSSDAKVATVNAAGKITGVSKGKCVIMVVSKIDETVKAELQVEVTEETMSDDSGSNYTSGNTGGNNAAGDNNSTESNTDTESTEVPSGGYYLDSYAEQVLAIVNVKRQEAGLEPLVMNSALVSAAKVRAGETVQSFSHTRPNGTSCFTAFDEAGVSYSGAGENIAAGQTSADSVMTAWMNSEGHRANILNGSYTQIGIACYYDPNSAYGYYWTQCFIY